MAERVAGAVSDAELVANATDPYLMERFEKAKAQYEREYLLATFRSFDEDGSGSIDREEFTRCCWRVLGGLSDEEVTAELEVIDANGDGEISLDEFQASVR